MKLLCEKNFVLLEVVLATIILEIVPNTARHNQGVD